MDIVLVEDNLDWRASCETFLAERFPRATVEVVETESSFYEKLADYKISPPAVFLVDIMFTWALPAPNIPIPPPEVLADNGFFRAGIRCWHRLHREPELKHIPVIYWTIVTLDDLKSEMERSDLPPGVYHVSKEGGWDELDRLLTKVLAKRSNRA